MVSITSFAYVIGRMRLETGSVWPAVVLHAAWDTVILSAFDRATTGADATLWVGESGILTAITLILAAIIFSCGQWNIIRTLPKRGEDRCSAGGHLSPTEGAISGARVTNAE